MKTHIPTLLLIAMILTGCAGTSQPTTFKGNIYTSTRQPKLSLAVDSSFAELQSKTDTSAESHYTGNYVSIRTQRTWLVDSQDGFAKRLILFEKKELPGKWYYEATSFPKDKYAIIGESRIGSHDFKYGVTPFRLTDEDIMTMLAENSLVPASHYMGKVMLRSTASNQLFYIYYFEALAPESVQDDEGKISQAKLYAKALETDGNFGEAIKAVE